MREWENEKSVVSHISVVGYSMIFYQTGVNWMGSIGRFIPERTNDSHKWRELFAACEIFGHFDQKW